MENTSSDLVTEHPIKPKIECDNLENDQQNITLSCNLNQKFSEEKCFVIKSEELDIKTEDEEIENNRLEANLYEDSNCNNEINLENGSIAKEEYEKLKGENSDQEQTCTKPRKQKRKKQFCHFCLTDVLNYHRHLKRKHENEDTVKAIVSMSYNDPRRQILFNSLRKQANYILNKKYSVIRPVRGLGTPEDSKKPPYVACEYCLGFFGRSRLRLHMKRCTMRRYDRKAMTTSKKRGERFKCLAEAQIFEICSDQNLKNFYTSLRITKEVFPFMRNDYISKVAMSDVVICCFADGQLRHMKNNATPTSISNKMRQMGRLLMALSKYSDRKTLFDFLTPEYFENIVKATEEICEHNKKDRACRVSSLAYYMRSNLKIICELVGKLVKTKFRFLQCENIEERLKDLKILHSHIQGWRIDGTAVRKSYEMNTIEETYVDDNEKQISNNNKNIDQKKKGERAVKEKWSEEHKQLIKEYFKDHIEIRKAPGRYECETFKKENPSLETKDWTKIKVFVYNVYRKL